MMNQAKQQYYRFIMLQKQKRLYQHIIADQFLLSNHPKAIENLKKVNEALTASTFFHTVDTIKAGVSTSAEYLN